MQQVSFKKEGFNHYMVIACEEELPQGYESKLLQFHEVPGILGFEYRIINGEPMLYYRLKYRTTLKAILPHMPLNKRQLYNMLKCIVDVLETAEDFLLPTEGIIMQSESIFVEADTGKLQFCYMPGRVENENAIRELLMELMDLIDKKNEENVLFVLQFYNLITEPDCTIKKLKNYLRSKSDEDKPATEKALPKELVFEEAIPEEPVIINDNKAVRENKKYKAVTLALILLVAINVILLLGLLLNIFSYNAMQYLFVTMGLLVVVAIIFMNMQKEESPDEIMQAYFEERKEINNDMFLETEPVHKEEKPLVYGETSVLSENEAQKESIAVEEEEQHLYLESLEQGKYEPIHVKNSVVLGCMAEGCSYILKDRGISRMHAKLMEKPDGLYLLDLNSTNGTYLNGELLESGEDYKIEAGDHIAFARSEFYAAVEAG